MRRANVSLAEFADNNVKSQHTKGKCVMISFFKKDNRPAESYILKPLYDSDSKIMRGFSVAYWPTIPAYVRKLKTWSTKPTGHTAYELIKWYAKEYQWHLAQENKNEDFNENQLIQSYVSSLLLFEIPKGSDNNQLLQYILLLLTPVLLIFQIVYYSLKRYFIKVNKQKWDHVDSSSKNHTKTNVHLYSFRAESRAMIFSTTNLGMVFKFEKPNGNAYWTTYVDSEWYLGKKGLAVCYVRELPENLVDYKYLGYLHSSPSQVIELFKEIEEKIGSKTKPFPLIITTGDDWAIALFYHAIEKFGKNTRFFIYFWLMCVLYKVIGIS